MTVTLTAWETTNICSVPYVELKRMTVTVSVFPVLMVLLGRSPCNRRTYVSGLLIKCSLHNSQDPWMDRVTLITVLFPDCTSLLCSSASSYPFQIFFYVAQASLKFSMLLPHLLSHLQMCVIMLTLFQSLCGQS